jgi:hypothetical protein
MQCVVLNLACISFLWLAFLWMFGHWSYLPPARLAVWLAAAIPLRSQLRRVSVTFSPCAIGSTGEYLYCAPVSVSSARSSA